MKEKFHKTVHAVLSKKKWPEEIILLSHVFVTNAVPRRGNMTTTFMIFCGINFFSRVLRDSTTRFVGPSVGPSHFTFFGFLWSLASQLLPKCSRQDFK